MVTLHTYTKTLMAKKTINNDVLLANIIKGIEEVKGNDIDILDLREIDNADRKSVV